MSRLIVCLACASTVELHADDPEVAAAGERVEIARGESRHIELLCDHCNGVIRQGERCAAVAIHVRGRAESTAWFDDFVRRDLGA